MPRQCRGILFLGMVLFGPAACAPPPAEPAAPAPFVGPLSFQPLLAVQSVSSPVLMRPGTAADFAAHVESRVLFAYDSPGLDSAAVAIVDRQAEWLRAFPEYRVLVEGHADERGGEDYNFALGLERAEAVRNRLVASGVEAVRVVTTSHGSSRPAVIGTGEAVWSLNRRAVTVLAN